MGFQAMCESILQNHVFVDGKPWDMSECNHIESEIMKSTFTIWVYIHFIFFFKQLMGLGLNTFSCV